MKVGEEAGSDTACRLMRSSAAAETRRLVLLYSAVSGSVRESSGGSRAAAWPCATPPHSCQDRPTAQAAPALSPVAQEPDQAEPRHARCT